MVNEIFNSKICVWEVDIEQFKRTSKFDKELEYAFKFSGHVYDAQQKEGDAISLKNGVMEKFLFFDDIIQLLHSSLNEQLNLLNVPKHKRNVQLVRCWANRMNKNSRGLIHHHQKGRMVLILYYDIPENSGDLVFIDSKHYDKLLMTEEEIPENDKKYLKVKNGMCVLHESELLHAVTKNLNDKPRQCLVFEFISLIEEGWQSG